APQSLNSYSYGNDNPTTKSDPKGLWAISYNLASIGAEGGFGLFAGGSAGLSLSFVSGKDGGLALTFSSACTGGYLQNSTGYPTSPSGQRPFIYGAFASGGCALQAVCGSAVQYSGSVSPTVNSLDALNGAADAMNLNYERASFTRQVDGDG